MYDLIVFVVSRVALDSKSPAPIPIDPGHLYEMHRKSAPFIQKRKNIDKKR
ncbi:MULTISPECIES: hypothetical protein [Pseudomonas]|uniref:hypothetical protein n=1 Tax=Pseudomonas TaxID=286 RepID=UPI00041B1E45|nr:MULTISPECIES: hypothetical protein [Pseudomonas]